MSYLKALHKMGVLEVKRASCNIEIRILNLACVPQETCPETMDDPPWKGLPAYGLFSMGKPNSPKVQFWEGVVAVRRASSSHLENWNYTNMQISVYHIIILWWFYNSGFWKQNSKLYFLPVIPSKSRLANFREAGVIVLATRQFVQEKNEKRR